MIKKLSFLIIIFPFAFILCDLIKLSDIIIHEHAPIGHLLVTLNTSIKQRSSYRFVSSNHREIQRYFSLNSSTGELRVAADIDRELICTHRHTRCKFLLKIFELFHEKLYYLPIIIEDINDHQPIFPYQTSEIKLHISENSPPYQSKLFIQQAYDQDQTDNQNQLKYELKCVTENFPFTLEIYNDLSNRLGLVLTQVLDRESIDSYNCTLYVIDTNQHYTQLYITIIIDDVNDQTPIFENDVYSVELSENTSINTTILQVHAYDTDTGLNGRITYDFTDASKHFSNIFSINNETGLVRLRSALDYEQRTSYIFYIEACDSGQEMRSSQTLVNITILDENDCYPIINFRFLPEINSNISEDIIEISENYSIDKFFVQILVTDEDKHLNGQVRLWLEDLNDRNDNRSEFNLYRLDNNTYFLNRTKYFDYENQQWYYLKFYAEDFSPKNPLQTNKILTIHIRDENDNVPQFIHSFYHLSVDENDRENLILTKIEAFDSDSGENGHITFEIIANENQLPFSIDSNTGILQCLQSFDRENRSYYHFDILARDHGYPLSLSSKISIQININDINDNKPIFEFDKYEFSIEENFSLLKPFGLVRAFDFDLNTNLIYYIENEPIFKINQYGELYLRNKIDHEIQDKYHFLIIVSDNYYKTSVPVYIQILDINDCKPQWINPLENSTVLFVNRDAITIETVIIQLEAIDRDDILNGNGLVSYLIEEKYGFLDLLNNGKLILNSTPIVGHYLLNIYAIDNGKYNQYASLIQINLLIGNNNTDQSQYYKKYHQINSLSVLQRIILLSTFALSFILILIFIVCIVFIMIYHYRKQQYLCYMKCHANHINEFKKANAQCRFTDMSSNSLKLSLEELHHKPSINYSSSYAGNNDSTNIYTQHHQVSSIVKPPQTTSDYYSNSSKHDEDIDEMTDEQRSTVNNNIDEWSIEKILYPDWLYKNTTISPKTNFSTSTFSNFNSYQTLETSRNSMTKTNNDERRIPLDSHLSPKQVRFDCYDQKYLYPHLNTMIRQLKTRATTTATVSNEDLHNTFI